MTVRGLEPEIQKLIAKNKAEIKRLNAVHEAELLAADERASKRFSMLIFIPGVCPYHAFIDLQRVFVNRKLTVFFALSEILLHLN